MKNHKFIVILISSLISSSLWAQEVYRLTLPIAVDLAKQQNTSVRNSMYDVAIAKQQIWETTAQGLPQVSSSISYNNNIDLPVTLVPALMFNPAASPDDFLELSFGVQHNAQFNFQISQLVFNGSYIVGLQTAKTFKMLSEQGQQRAVNEVIKSTTQSYNTLLFSLKNRQMLQTTYEDMAKTYSEIKKTYEVGLADESKADQLLLNKLTIENALKTVDRQILLQYDLLKIQLGLNQTDSIILTDSLDQVFNSSNFETALLAKIDLSKNIDLQLMKTQEEVNVQQMRFQKSTLLPSVNAFFSHNQSGMSDEFKFFSKDQKWFASNIIGASLVIPITTSGGTLARIKQAELELQKTKNNRLLMEQNLLAGAQSAKNKLASEYESYNIQKKNLELAQKIYNKALLQFRQGMLSSTELTQLNTQLYNTQSAYFAAMLNVLNAQADLDNILGKNL